MKLSEYFDGTRGMGVLSTANSSGQVDSAIYARPHFLDEDTVAFIMADRLSHANLQSNPHAAYLFKEGGPHYTGKRLSLTRIREEKDSPLIDQIRRRKRSGSEEAGEPGSRFLVVFRIDKVRPLIGDGDQG